MLELIHSAVKDNAFNNTFPKTRFIEMIYEIRKISDKCDDNLDLNCDNDYVNSILESDLKYIKNSRKTAVYPNLYKAILEVYKDDNNKDCIISSYRTFLKKKNYKFDKAHIVSFRNDIKDILDKTSIKQYDKDLILSFYEIEPLLYYLIRYAITGHTNNKYKEDGFISYWKDLEEYSSISANNLLGGNINDRGLKNVLALNVKRLHDINNDHINTVAQFDRGVRILFGNAPDYIKDHAKALQCFEDILAVNPVMPLANWGVAYIVFNYTSTYTDKHKDEKIDRYKKAYDLAKKSSEYGCAAAYNLLGVICREYKIEEKSITRIKEFDKADPLDYFNISLNKGYYFALNNIGDNYIQKANDKNIDEKTKTEYLNKAYNNFKEFADLAYEAYACNMVGKMIMGKYGDFGEPRDKKVALYYWRLAIENDDSCYNCHWSKYNIAKYLYPDYKNGLITDKRDAKTIKEAYNYIAKYSKSKRTDDKFINACKERINKLNS